jgi:hypothetical protein
MWRRYERHKQGTDSIETMAYHALTVLERRFPGKTGRKDRKTIACSLNLEGTILKGLGRLSSKRGGPLTARKYDPTSQPLSTQEINWIATVVRLLIQRLGEYEAAPSSPLPKTTMSDLPRLS